MCMSPGLLSKVCTSLGSTPCSGLSHGGFVVIISISLVVQFLGFCLADNTFRNSLSSSILGYCPCMSAC
jgi:hypothetical protein